MSKKKCNFALVTSAMTGGTYAVNKFTTFGLHSLCQRK